LSHSPSPNFTLIIFQIGSHTFLSSTYASQVAEILGMYHHAYLVCGDRVSLIFFGEGNAWAGLEL
jgi:hypothetical protein